MKLTVKKIAELAGVSRGTVDRALNNRSGVNDETRKKIQDIIDKHDYTPNKAARALSLNSKPVKIAVLTPPEDIAFFEDVYKGIRAITTELKDFGFTVLHRHVSNKNPQEVVSVLNELLNAGVNGFAVSIMDSEDIRKKLLEIEQKNIPVVTFNSDIDGIKRLCYVGQDVYKSGKVAAGLASKILSEGDKIIAITGNMSFKAHRARVEGFRDGLKEIGTGPVLLETIEAFENYEITRKSILDAINKDHEIRGIYMATGSIKACIEALSNIGNTRRIRVICNDMLPEIAEALNMGIIDFTICQDPYTQGYMPVKILYDYLVSGITPEDTFMTEISIKICQNMS